MTLRIPVTDNNSVFSVLIQIARAATIFNVDEVVVFDELGSTLERCSCVCANVCVVDILI